MLIAAAANPTGHMNIGQVSPTRRVSDFQKKYPKGTITHVESRAARCEIAEIRHSSLYVPRDFDISPYFMVVKPTLARGFNYKDMRWADLPYPAEVHAAQLTLVPETEGELVEAAYGPAE